MPFISTSMLPPGTPLPDREYPFPPPTGTMAPPLETLYYQVMLEFKKGLAQLSYRLATPSISLAGLHLNDIGLSSMKKSSQVRRANLFSAPVDGPLDIAITKNC